MSKHLSFIIIVLLASTALSIAQSSVISKSSKKTNQKERIDSIHLAHDNEIVVPESLNEKVES